MRFLLLCYETDDTGMCNIDQVTGRILIPTPWGRLGHIPYGLRRLEADVLRRVLFRWSEPTANRIPVWTYDPGGRSWALNIYDYPQFDDARPYVQMREITAQIFAELHATVYVRKAVKP